MCGIVGFSGDFEESLLHRMIEVQRHRGPDGSGVYHDAEAAIGLGHGRLAIIDLSDAALQPMWSHDRRVVIVYNGEIYNYRELRDELLAAGHSFATNSDTEVIIEMYRAYGRDMLARLNGMFAFALLDLDTNDLLIARDRFGVKPLYYTRNATGMAFASELRTLCCVPGLSLELDREALACTLTYMWAPAPMTLLRDVRKLLPGSAMIVRRGECIEEWQFAPAAHFQPPSHQGEREQAGELRHLLSAAVERQLVADVPVGSFLSGGLDSSAIVALAKQVSGKDVECFTMDDRRPDKGFVADLPYAERVAIELDVPLVVLPLSDDLAQRFSEFVGEQDQPVADPAAFNVYEICRLAHESDIKVLLSGAGGDDLFSGYRRHNALVAEQFWTAAPATLRGWMRSAASLLPTSIPLGRRIQKAFQYADLSAPERLVAYFYWFDPARAAKLCKSESDPTAPLRAEIAKLPTWLSPLEQMLHLERTYFLVDHNLAYTDASAMRHGVEVRVPFLDPDLVDFSTSIPPDRKVRGSRAKWLFKQSMKGILPADIIWRPKVGFGGPLNRWLRGPMKPWLDRQLASPMATMMFDVAETRNLVDRFSAGSDEVGYTLFALATAIAWYRSVQEQHRQLAA